MNRKKGRKKKKAKGTVKLCINKTCMRESYKSEPLAKEVMTRRDCMSEGELDVRMFNPTKPLCDKYQTTTTYSALTLAHPLP